MLDDAIKVDPSHPALVLATTRLYSLSQESQQPEISRQASAVELHEMGRREIERGRLSEARALFSRALKKDPSMPHAYVSWARMEAQLGDVQRAIEIYEEGYTSCHPSQQSWGFRTVPSSNTSRNEPSSNSLEASSCSKEEKDSVKSGLTGLQFQNTSKFQRQAKKFLPLLHSWATLEESQGRLTKARGLLKEGLELDPGHIPSWMTLGRVIWALGGAEEGRKVWGLGLEVAGPSAPLLHQWAQKELRAGGNIQPHKSMGEQKWVEASPSPSPSPSISNGASTAAQLPKETNEDHRDIDSPQANRDIQVKTTSLSSDTNNSKSEDKENLNDFSSDSHRWPNNLIKPWKASSWSVAPTAQAARSRARALLALALEIDPLHGPSIQAIAALEDRAGLVQRSDAHYLSHLVDQGPSSSSSPPSSPYLPQVLHSRAIQLLKRGDKDQAMHLLSQLSVMHPNNPHLCHTMGLLAQQEGQWEKAKGFFFKGTKAGNLPSSLSSHPHIPTASNASLPGHLLCYEGLAELLAFKGDIQAAKMVYETGFKSYRAIKLTPRFLRQYASFEKRSGSLQMSSDLYRLAAQIEPCDPKTWLQWGVVEKRRKRYDMAEECFRRGVAAAPTHPHLWYAYSTMQWKLGNIEGARATFKQATGLCPRSPPLWMEWAIMEWTSPQGKGAEEARRLFQNGSDSSKITAPYQHPPLFQAWADMERAHGNEERAEELLELASLYSTRKGRKEG